MPEAVHIASGKVREIFALDDDRLLLVASDRISTFDVILPTPIPDKGRVLTGLSSFWFSRTAHIVPNHLLELRDDGRTMVCRKLRDAAHRMCRPRLSHRLGLARLPARREPSAATCCPRACGTRTDCLLRSSPRPRRRAKVTTRTSTRSRRPSFAVPISIAPPRRPRSPCTDSPPSTPRSVGSSWPTRSSSSASRRTARSCSETRR